MSKAAPDAVRAFDFIADGRKVYCVAEGQGEPVFVLIHGYAADHTTWLLTQPALAARGTVYAPDLPGGGLSSLDVGNGGIDFFAGIVLALMDHAGIGRAHLVGHSMGAAVAVAVAATDLRRVSALTLIGPSGIDPWINMDFIAGFPLIRDLVEARRMMEMLVANPRMISRDMLELVLAYTTTPGVTQALETVAAANFPGHQVCLFKDWLAGLGVPSRIVWGEKDAIVRPIATGFPPQIPVSVLPKAGHLVHLETPEAVNRLILG
jgi:pyruvate dehydrogenase E2 component (dihydrolipoamide acetyltransferase)